MTMAIIPKYVKEIVLHKLKDSMLQEGKEIPDVKEIGINGGRAGINGGRVTSPYQSKPSTQT
jgi:hypothetical protein